MELSKIKAGNWIQFRSWTREGTKTAIRKVKKIQDGRVQVGYFGWSNFEVYPREILEVFKENPKK